MNNTNTLAQRASQALRAGDRRDFVRTTSALIDARAPLTSGWKALSQPLIDWGELNLARRVMDLYVTASAGAHQAQFDRALIYTQTGCPAEAAAMLETLPNTIPDRAGNAYLRGTIALNLGHRDIARDALLEALSLRPMAGQIYQTLSMLGSMASEPSIAERILAARQAMRAVPDADRAPYCYALGKVFDDLDEIDDAFTAFAEGAAIVAASRPYDPELDRRLAGMAVDGWTGEGIATVSARVRIETDRPIIVTGLPRSGSTLVEHVLASHSMVGDGDELGRFHIVVDEIGGAGWPAFERWQRSRNPTDMARLYLHLLKQRFGDAQRVVDKSLEASRYLGTLAALMPDAPILWMRRDPLDNAWSCFSTWFLAGLPWSWRQDVLATHFRLEDALFAQWRAILGDRLMTVDYQALVTDKERQIPSLLDHCGLPMEPQVLTPENNPRLVTTASVMQVRAPINSAAVNKGHRYRRHMQPFIDAYEYVG